MYASPWSGSNSCEWGLCSACFQYKTDAERFHEELGKRLGKFGLEVESTKTKVMEFGRFATSNLLGWFY